MAEPRRRSDVEPSSVAGDTTCEPSREKPATGKALLEALQGEGILGMWRTRQDIADSTSYARALRAASETRP